jgi:hypothetical protein
LQQGLDHQVTVTIHLLRKTGAVASGTRISPSAVDSSGSPIGTFGFPTASDSEGKLTVPFTAGGVSYTGRIDIRATVDTGGGSVTGVVPLQITP